MAYYGAAMASSCNISAVDVKARSLQFVASLVLLLILVMIAAEVSVVCPPLSPPAQAEQQIVDFEYSYTYKAPWFVD